MPSPAREAATLGVGMPGAGMPTPSVADPGTVCAADVAPLVIRHNPMLGRYDVTLCCIVHNELFFLEAFLQHYRRLGVQRFIVLDDRSTDGTAAFLRAQPDVMVVGSDLRYAQQIAYDPETLARIRETRTVRLWRDQLLNQFCTDMWAVVVDPDEFLALPEDMDLRAFTAKLTQEGVEAVWGSMLDMYPRAVSDILDPPEGATFSLEDDWFFDARPHLRLRPRQEIPKAVYPGSAARLFCEYGVMPQGSLNQRLRRRLTGYRYATHSMIHKTPIVFWRAGDYCLNCHLTNKPVGPRYLVPMMHFKFTRDLGRKIRFALETAAYNQGSRSYRLYEALIMRMQDQDGAFLFDGSQKFTSFEDFRQAGIARL